MVGIHTVIDCATARPEENAQKVDWDGKVGLIQCAQVIDHACAQAHMPPWCVSAQPCARRVGWEVDQRLAGSWWPDSCRAEQSCAAFLKCCLRWCSSGAVGGGWWTGSHKLQRPLQAAVAVQRGWAGVQLPPACSRVTTNAECLTLTSVALQALGIQRYIFFSIHNCAAHPEVPLMQFKACTEQYLKDSGLNYTIFRLCGFMQVRGSVCDVIPLVDDLVVHWQF